MMRSNEKNTTDDLLKETPTNFESVFNGPFGEQKR